MYQIIQNIIDHSWNTGSSEQQYIYYICGSVIVLTFVFFFDALSQIIKCFRKNGEK